MKRWALRVILEDNAIWELEGPYIEDDAANVLFLKAMGSGLRQAGYTVALLDRKLIEHVMPLDQGA